MKIEEAVHQILKNIPPDVALIAAAKKRTVEEIETAIQAGITHIGHNYIQEAQRMLEKINPKLREKSTWHIIGHVQRNKVAHAVRLCDMIQTVDSVELGEEISHRCVQIGKTIPVLVEVNSGRESNKTGVFPEQTNDLVIALSKMDNLRVEGLMTIGPFVENPGDLRAYFKITRQLWENLSKESLPNVTMHWLSMGMSDSYLIAIEEGANMVRIGTKLFGPRA